MTNIATLVQNAQTSVQARPTTARLINTPTWEKATGFQSLSDPQLTDMLHSTANWLLDIDEGAKPRWLSLVGRSGTGKTMLARFAMQALRRSVHWKSYVDDSGDNHLAGSFVLWPVLAEQLQANSGREWLDEMTRYRFLFLDDIGQTVDKTGYVTGKLSTLLSQRTGKWTFLTSNLSVKQVAEKVDPRVASRMIRDGNSVVDVDVMDWSLRKLA